MKSMPVRPVLKILPIAPPKGAREAYTVVSRKLSASRAATYDVVIWPDTYYHERKHKTVQCLRFTCECMDSQYARPCYHIVAVISKRVPTARCWRTEPDALRQHRRTYPVKYGPNAVTTGSRTRARILWITERCAFLRKRGRVHADGTVTISQKPLV